MKKKRKRSPSYTPHLKRVTEISVPTDDVVLADIRATREDSDVLIMPLSNRIEDEDAIDRLLVHGGFVPAEIGIDGQTDGIIEKTVGPLTALDDFEPDIGDGYKVQSVDQDSIMQVHAVIEPVLAVPDLDLKADRHENISPAPEPLGRMFAETEFNELLAESTDARLFDVAIAHEAEVSAVSSDVAEPAPTRIESEIEPILIEPAVSVVKLPIVPVEITPDALAEPVLGFDHDPARQSVDSPIPEPLVLPISQNTDTDQASQCGYKTEQARINLVTLILSILASLSTIVLYFMLMDIKEDVVKLNEIIDIMKDDIQMNRQEPPAE